MNFVASATDWLTQVALVAQRDAWESLGNRFSGEHTQFNVADLVALVVVIASAVGLILLLRWLQLRQEARRQSNDPRHLFNDLCAAHRLSRRDRQLLRHLAAASHLDAACFIFVRPDLFEPNQLPPGMEQHAEKVVRLGRQLFRGLPDQVPTNADETEGAPTQAPVAPATVPATTLPPTDAVTTGE